MLRFCLLLGLTLPLWATSITGAFDISERSNFADVTGDGFAWQFHQGNAANVLAACAGTQCSLDGSAAPAALALLRPDNWFRAVNGPASAQGNINPGEITGGIGGSFSWHVARTDWSDLPAGESVAISVPMDITGLLTAVDAQGVPFMEKTLSGTGTFETTALRADGGVTFFGAAGRFSGTVTGTNPTLKASDSGAPGFVAGSGDPAPPVLKAEFAGFKAGDKSAPPQGPAAPTAAPEPAMYLMIGIGLASIAALRRLLSV